MTKHNHNLETEKGLRDFLRDPLTQTLNKKLLEAFEREFPKKDGAKDDTLG